MKYLLCLFMFFSVLCNVASATDVVVIAHSVSTRMESRSVLSRNNLHEVSDYRSADGILVVCRSELYYPLRESYKSIKELDDDADHQLNISGSYMHVYLYSFEGQNGVREVDHIKYHAGDL